MEGVFVTMRKDIRITNFSKKGEFSDSSPNPYNIDLLDRIWLGGQLQWKDK
jgi:hypothetical protein